MFVRGVGVPHATVAGVRWNYKRIILIMVARKPTIIRPANQYSSDTG